MGVGRAGGRGSERGREGRGGRVEVAGLTCHELTMPENVEKTSRVGLKIQMKVAFGIYWNKILFSAKKFKFSSTDNLLYKLNDWAI